jgi:16S rRNA processing protein RimM
MRADNPAQQLAQQWVWLARIRRSQGRKGEVFADILTDFPEKFSERKQLWLVAEPETPLAKNHPAPREVELVNHWLHKGGIVLLFAQSDSISSAEALAGLHVAIPWDQRSDLGEDEVYIADLIGCRVIDMAGVDGSGHEQFGEAGVDVGVIEDVDRAAGPTPILVVLGKKGEVLIPFAKSFMRKIDLAARRVEMALPEGLVDLNG